ncbi:MAG: Fur family transcriptional regulator [Bacillota bacterium]
MAGEIERFKRYLAMKGCRLTTERQLTLEAILDFSDHFTAEDLLERLRSRRNKVSRASVYRTLEVLVACGMLRKMGLGENRAYYEYHWQTHHHLVCAECGKVIEFTHPLFKELEEVVRSTYGFNVVDYTQTIAGICQACSSKSNN